MIRKSILGCFFTLICLPGFSLFAKENTHVESFIDHVRENTQFVRIDDIWQPDDNFDKTAMLQKVEKAQPLTIDYARVASLLQSKTTAISLVLPGTDGKTYTVDLARYNFLSNDFQVHTLGNDNKDELFDYTPGLYYRGVVNGIPGSVAAFSFFNNEVYGIFSIPGEGNYTLVPNVMVGKYYDYNTHYVLYNDNDLKIKDMGPKCETDKLPEMNHASERTTTTLNNNVYNNCIDIRIFEVGDYALFRTKGSNATNVTNYLTALFNNQATIYRNEGIGIVLKYVQVNTTTDNYQHITTSNSALFLDTFGKVTQNTLHGCDLALLVSTALNGGYGALGGIAWVQAMCYAYSPSSFFGPYGFCDMDNSAITNFPTYSWDVEVITHEMGHIVGSPHTHRCCWNPPARITAIDGCYTIEGTCPDPGRPSSAVGGTIMSYCHLTSTGINFSNGFGPQPGDTVRYFIKKRFSASCGVHYNPNIAVSITSRVLSANRECTDIVSGDTTTYYWNDRNTADQADDTLVLMIKKHGANIGNLNTAGFRVSSGTLPDYGSSRADTITFPTGVTGVSGKNFAMHRYWKVQATTDPTTAVEVIFPFLQADTSDVNGSVPGVSAPLANYKMYKVDDTVNASPTSNFTGATASSFHIYTFGTAPSTTNWSFTTSGSTYLAHMMMTDLTGGGTGFYNYVAAGVEHLNAAASDIYIYPNPTHDKWNISVGNNGGQPLSFNLYAADGRLINVQTLKEDSITTIDASQLSTGVYYFRVIGGSGSYTGNVVKQ